MVRRSPCGRGPTAGLLALGLAGLVAVGGARLHAQAPDTEVPPVTLGGPGIRAEADDGRHSLRLWFRGQFRYSYPFDDAPTTVEGFAADPASTFDVRRFRLKLGGNAYASWLGYYVEYDLPSNRLLDYRFTISRLQWLQLRVGQWKVNFNRERADSSGKQQFVERSIVNREFTVDRQPGVMVGGRLRPGRLGDSWYMAGVFNGNGINTRNDDGSMMWFGRYHWNVLARDLPYGQSDVEYHEEPAASLSVATLRNRSRFTRFSSSGGGQLDGFEEPLPDQPERYRIEQYLVETAFKYRGFSWQHETHWKQVDDEVLARTTHLSGFYTQAGYFPWRHGDGVRPLEVAVRYAAVDPDTSLDDDERTELTVGANWFFAGHDNKITVDASRLTLTQPDASSIVDHRVRAQWDVSF